MRTLNLDTVVGWVTTKGWAIGVVQEVIHRRRGEGWSLYRVRLWARKTTATVRYPSEDPTFAVLAKDGREFGRLWMYEKLWGVGTLKKRG